MKDRIAIVMLKAKCEKEILIAFFGLTAIITNIEAKEIPLADIRKPSTILILTEQFKLLIIYIIMFDLVQQDSLQFLTQHYNLRIIAVVATLLKIIPNTFFIVSYAGQWLPASLQAAIKAFFENPVQQLTYISSTSLSTPSVESFITWVFPNGFGQDLLDLLTLNAWPYNLVVVLAAMLAQLPGDIQMLVQAALVDQTNEEDMANSLQAQFHAGAQPVQWLVELIIVLLATFVYIDTVPLLVLSMWSSLSLHGIAIFAYDYYLIDYLNV